MKFTLTICFLLISFLKANGQDFIPDRYLKMTFNIKYGNSTGTTFLIYEDSANYFVTARHIFPNPVNKQKVIFEILQDTIWKEVDGILLVSNNPLIDVAVIKPNLKDTIKGTMSLQTTGIEILGDDCYFLGFPFGFNTKDNGGLNEGFPFPLIKKATFSGGNTENGVSFILLDGHNNPGFSGGPVIFIDRYAKNNNKWFVGGVISAYVNERKQMITPFGKFNYDENSGIIVAISAKHIRELIKSQ